MKFCRGLRGWWKEEEIIDIEDDDVQIIEDEIVIEEEIEIEKEIVIVEEITVLKDLR